MPPVVRKRITPAKLQVLSAVGMILVAMAGLRMVEGGQWILERSISEDQPEELASTKRKGLRRNKR